MNFKPMLAADLAGVDLASLRYPLLGSPKLDGLRCILWEGVAYSRNAKPFRNGAVQEWAKGLHNLDGELIVGSATEGEVLGRTQSGIMAFDGMPDFTFHLFDCVERPYGYAASLDEAWASYGTRPRISLVPQTLILNHSELLLIEASSLAQGYEGEMLRDPDGPYKHGRSTLREGYLMKLKQFQDGEAVVTGLEEGSSNQNVATKDELGRTKRSKDSTGLVPSGMVGTILAADPKWGALRIAPGVMSHAERVRYLAHPEHLLGETIHWRSFGYGSKNAPRYARFYGVRQEL